MNGSRDLNVFTRGSSKYYLLFDNIRGVSEALSTLTRLTCLLRNIYIYCVTGVWL